MKKTQHTLFHEINILEQPYIGEDQRYHYFYKITNLLNGAIYYGIHSTKNINDHYAGSGKILNLSYKKYGKNNFTMDIVKFFDSREALSLHEHNIVNAEFVSKENTYNIKEGGDGWNNLGYVSAIDNDGNTKMISKDEFDNNREKYNGVTKGMGLVKLNKNDKNYFYMRLDDPNYDNMYHCNTGIASVLDNEGNAIKLPVEEYHIQKKKNNYKSFWEGKHHTQETKEKIKKILHEQNKILYGEKHPQYGKQWITNGIKNLLLTQEQSEEYISNGWTYGRSHMLYTMTEKKKQSYIDRCYINKDGINKLIKKYDIQKYIEKGWSIGRIREKTIWMNKDGKSLMIKETEIESHTMAGWMKGRK